MKPLLLALLAAPLALAQVSNPEPASLSIEGTLTDQLSGAPIAGGRIVLDEHYPGRTLAYSDAAGHFQFDSLRPGAHHLLARRTGYLQASQLAVLYSGRNSPAVRIALTPQAVIAGTVEDQDGFPVAEASIIVFTRSAGGELVSASRGGVTTDDHGRFRAAGLASGSYYLHVQPGLAGNWDARYTDVYYPAALKFEDAEAIQTTSGQERSGIVVRLQISAGVRVQGRVALPPGFAIQHGGGRAQVSLTSAGIAGFARTTNAMVADDGSFTFNHVQPGKYQLVPVLPPPYGRGFTTGPAGAVEPNLEVGAADISGIALNVEDTMPVDLPGKVVFAAGVQPEPVIVLLTQRNSVQAQTASQEDGSFVLRAVPPGKYYLSANATAGSLRGVSARLGEADLPYGALELKGPNPGSLVITMSSAFGVVQGVIVDAAGQPVSGQYALFHAVKPGLLPPAPGKTDPAGHFWAGLPPGDYRVWPAAAVPADYRFGGSDAPPGQGQLVTIVEGPNPPLRLVLAAVK